jgi:hypothetical protein
VERHHQRQAARPLVGEAEEQGQDQDRRHDAPNDRLS